MSNSTKELRVLSGAHAGAKVPLNDKLSIGSSPECDVILTDTGIEKKHISVSLTADPKKWSTIGLDFPLTKESLSLGENLWIGTIAITVDESNTTWPKSITPPPFTQDPQEEKKSTTIEKKSKKSEKLEEEIEEIEEKKDKREEKNLKVSLENLRSPLYKKIASYSIILLSITLLGVSALYLYENQKSTLFENEKEDPDIILITSSFSQKGVENLSIYREGEKIIISGWLPNRSDYNNLVRVTSTMMSEAVIQVSVEDEINEEVIQIIKKNYPEIKVSFLGRGNIALSGIATDNMLSDILEKLNSDVHGLEKIDTRKIEMPRDIAGRFQNMVEQKKLPINLRISGNLIEAEGNLTRSEIQIWEKILSSFNHKYKNLVTVQAVINEMPDKLDTTKGGDREIDTESGAYGIYSVIGGSNKYVITKEGTRVMIGGRIGQFRLADVTNAEIVLDGPHKLVIRR